jgi:hypothetical protein
MIPSLQLGQSGRTIIGAVATSSPWTPAALGSDLYAWLISDDPSNTYSGSNWSQLFDKSGNAHHGGPTGTFGRRAGINGRQTVYTTAPGQLFILNSSTAYSQNRAGLTVACVSNIDPDDGVAASRTLMVQETNASGFTRVGVNAGIAGGTANRPLALARRLDADSAVIANAGAAKTGATVTIGIFDYANGQIYCSSDGTVTSAALAGSGNTSNTASFLSIHLLQFPGGSNQFLGDVGEWVLTTTALSSTNREKLEGYLAHAWGTTAALPALHPYKSVAPTL